MIPSSIHQFSSLNQNCLRLPLGVIISNCQVMNFFLYFNFSDDDYVSSSPGASGIFRRSLPMLSETPLEFSELHSPCTSPPLTATLPEIPHSKSSQTHSIQLSEFEEDWDELR